MLAKDDSSSVTSGTTWSRSALLLLACALGLPAAGCAEELDLDQPADPAANPAPPCRKLACDRATGTCEWVPVADSEEVSCDDGDACTTVDMCAGGSCVGTSPVSCSGGHHCEGGACVCGDLGAECSDALHCEAGKCVCGDLGVACSDAHHCDGGECVCGDLGVECPSGFTCTLGQAPETPVVHCLGQWPHQVYVPDGTFWMGCNDSGAEPIDTQCRDQEHDQHEVDLPAFVIDRMEVTASDYEACVLDDGCSPPSTVGGVHGTYAAGKDQHPINYVDWTQATAFCTWRAGVQYKAAWRLCSESEWEKAARGGCDLYSGDCATAMPKYPWGNENPSCASPALAVFDPGPLPDGCGTGQTWPVGSEPDGVSPYGALDMAGNVWEWVEDCSFGNYDGAPSDGSAWVSPACSSRIARGGSFVDIADYVRASFRFGLAPSSSYKGLGFRCCRSFP